MIRCPFISGCARAIAALLFVSAASFAQSTPQGSGGPGGGLKIIDNPGGGRIAYGHLSGQTSKPDAMVLVLHKVHTEFGDRPQLGKFFQSKDGDSIAAFFTVTARTQGNKPVAGLAIVHMAAGAPPAAAVLFDDASRFRRTEPAMMARLIDAWRSEGGGSAPASSGSGPQGQPATASAQAAPSSNPAKAPVAQTGALADQPSTAGDRSASVRLAPGWHIKDVYAGQLTAEGPNGEVAGLGLQFGTIRDASGARGGLPGQPAQDMCPYSGNLFDAYVCVANQRRRNNHLSQATFKLLRSVPGNKSDPPSLTAFFEVDKNDGTGLRKGSALITAFRTPGSPTWLMMVTANDAPASVADAENATIMAMCNSFKQDQAVIDQETKAINAQTKAMQAQQASRQAAFDQHMKDIDQKSAAFSQHMQNIDSQSAAFGQHMDSIDRSSKAFQNYILDQSVAKDADTGDRGTISNTYADALVKANPDRFQVVQNQDWIKGRDY